VKKLLAIALMGLLLVPVMQARPGVAVGWHGGRWHGGHGGCCWGGWGFAAGVSLGALATRPSGTCSVRASRVPGLAVHDRRNAHTNNRLGAEQRQRGNYAKSSPQP
jgi:hypothetical protein